MTSEIEVNFQINEKPNSRQLYENLYLNISILEKKISTKGGGGGRLILATLTDKYTHDQNKE